MVKNKDPRNESIDIDYVDGLVREAYPSSASLEITLPKKFCKKHNIRPGDQMKLLANDILLIAPKSKVESMKKLRKVLAMEIEEE